MEYNKITEESLLKSIKDIISTTPECETPFVVYVTAYEDKDGNIICPFMDKFNEAMKEELKNYDSTRTETNP